MLNHKKINVLNGGVCMVTLFRQYCAVIGMIFLPLVLFSSFSLEKRTFLEWRAKCTWAEDFSSHRENGGQQHYIPVEFQLPRVVDRSGRDQSIPVVDAEMAESNPIRGLISAGGIKKVSSQTGNRFLAESFSAGLFERAGPGY